MLDVMILLFSMFLMLPITQRATEAKNVLDEMSLPELVATAKEAQQKNDELRRENEELKLQKAAQKNRLELLEKNVEARNKNLKNRLAGLMKNASNYPMYLKDGRMPVVTAERNGKPADIPLDIFGNEAKVMAEIRRLSKVANKNGKILSFILLHTNERSGPAGAFERILRWFQDREIVVSYLELRN